jgi:hypothetical protein
MSGAATVNEPSYSPGNVRSMRLRLFRRSSMQASECHSRFDHGDRMEPKSPIKLRDPTETFPPRPSYPMDAEDYFELAYEVDEFGVHAPYQTDDK